MFVEVLSLTYHSPRKSDAVAWRALLGTSTACPSMSNRAGSFRCLREPRCPGLTRNASFRDLRRHRGRRRTERLGGATTVRRGDGVSGAASRSAEPRQVCQSEPRQL